ncbi:MAG: ABC transporter substrate-binding protein [Propionibacteriaceae bacterium]|nr:ABC transporter substrate-binding protein [Propionibacteriaceae bacterium]
MIRRTLVPALATILILSACAGPVSEDAPAISVENCGATVTFSEPPERVTLIDNPSVATLAALGVLDRVTAKAGLYPTQYYPAEVAQQLESIETLTDKVDATGHLQISREMVTATSPDLVIGSSDTVNRTTLGDTTPLLDEPAYCGSLTGEVTFEDAFDQVRLHGEVFQRQEAAVEYIEALQQRVAEAQREPDGRTVAVLYPTPGSPVAYAYGHGSMSHPVVTAAGLTNVFADEEQRVFEVSAEELVARNPDVILALYSDGDPQAILDAVTALPGADAITAVRDGHILPMLLSFAEPPSPLAVDGLELLGSYLDTP